MKKLKLSESGERGWFIGDFPEAVVRTKDFEVCYQFNSAGTPVRDHYHKIVTEVQLVTEGRMRVNNIEFSEGDICYLDPGEHYHCEILEDTAVVSIKFPSVPDDKYYL